MFPIQTQEEEEDEGERRRRIGDTYPTYPTGHLYSYRILQDTNMVPIQTQEEEEGDEMGVKDGEGQV